MDKIKIVLVDDHEMVRLGLKSFLNLQADVEVIGEASNGLEGIKKSTGVTSRRCCYGLSNA